MEHCLDSLMTLTARTDQMPTATMPHSVDSSILSLNSALQHLGWLHLKIQNKAAKDWLSFHKEQIKKEGKKFKIKQVTGMLQTFCIITQLLTIYS